MHGTSRDRAAGAFSCATLRAMDPVVDVALRSLQQRVNVGAGLAYPADMRAAVEVFQILAQHGYAWDPDEVERWAINHAWPEQTAVELRYFAAGVRSGYRFALARGRPTWAATVIELWRAEAGRRPLA